MKSSCWLSYHYCVLLYDLRIKLMNTEWSKPCHHRHHHHMIIVTCSHWFSFHSHWHCLKWHMVILMMMSCLLANPLIKGKHICQSVFFSFSGGFKGMGRLPPVGSEFFLDYVTFSRKAYSSLCAYTINDDKADTLSFASVQNFWICHICRFFF